MRVMPSLNARIRKRLGVEPQIFHRWFISAEIEGYVTWQQAFNHFRNNGPHKLLYLKIELHKQHVYRKSSDKIKDILFKTESMQAKSLSVCPECQTVHSGTKLEQLCMVCRRILRRATVEERAFTEVEKEFKNPRCKECRFEFPRYDTLDNSCESDQSESLTSSSNLLRGRSNMVGNRCRKCYERIIREQKTLKKPTMTKNDICRMCRKPFGINRKQFAHHVHGTTEFMCWLCLGCNTSLGHHKDNAQSMLQNCIQFLTNQTLSQEECMSVLSILVKER